MAGWSASIAEESDVSITPGREMERKEEAGAGEIRDSRLGRKGCALGKGKEKGKDKIQSERNSLREATNNGDPLIKMDEKNTMKSRENKGNRCFES